MKHANLGPMGCTLCAWVWLTAPSAGAQTPAPPPAPPAPVAAAAVPEANAAPSREQISYLFGLEFGEQLHGIGITDQVAVEAIARGLKSGLEGKKTTTGEQRQIQEFAHSAIGAATTRNKTAAREFLAHNAHEKGIKTTPSGLQYRILAAGDGKAAPVMATDEVTVQYRGKLLDGSEFDSSYARGTPASFPVNGVIKGWQEALVLMKPGAKWQLFVPPELAYDASPRPGIPGGSLLIFDVELLSAKVGGTPKAPPVHRMTIPKTPTPPLDK